MFSQSSCLLTCLCAPAHRRALGDPDFKAPRRLVEAEPDVARVALQPGVDQFLVLARCALLRTLCGSTYAAAA